MRQLEATARGEARDEARDEARYEARDEARYEARDEARYEARGEAKGSLTTNITLQDFTVFTTDPQSKWLPFNSPSLPAQHSPQQRPLQYQHQSVNPESQTQTEEAHRCHSANPASKQYLHHQRIDALNNSSPGHSSSTHSLANDPNFHPLPQRQQQQEQPFYASSAPSSTTALHHRQRLRAPAPSFHSQPTVNTSQANMTTNFGADMELFGNNGFTTFDGGAPMNNAFPSNFSSPAVPTSYDFDFPNNTSSQASTNTGTVSPQDLLMAHDHFSGGSSAPPSANFTNLTSPSIYNESPEYNAEFSPFTNNGDFDLERVADPWYPLFPETQDQTRAENSLLVHDEELKVGAQLKANRRKSGLASSPPANMNGVGKSRKRNEPLPPIIVDDPHDTEAMKRARNTLAARKSRQRKMQKMEDMEDKVAKLEMERDHWKSLALKRDPNSRPFGQQ
ncbi:hypothetical protein BJ878DRAFT_547533 [Calycina marina]|uniref:BZIP domain-containing protein n=1 Tax=Calycina marina TaxID=1763456 RepID=A0A9P7Z5G6_9HELO|nr:hypothetical protein BJ878DRAFT_547533 [Calycina marina]